jgi:hypothetical protein
MAVTKQTILEFGQFAIAQLDAGKTVEHLDELLDAFEVAQRSPETVAADVAAVRASLEDWQRGERGRSLEEFDADFRARNGIAKG